jgi:hypothetical protein
MVAIGAMALLDGGESAVVWGGGAPVDATAAGAIRTAAASVRAPNTAPLSMEPPGCRVAGRNVLVRALSRAIVRFV